MYDKKNENALETIPILRQQKDWMGGVRKRAILADVQYNSRWRNVGWVGQKKYQKFADVI